MYGTCLSECNPYVRIIENEMDPLNNFFLSEQSNLTITFVYTNLRCAGSPFILSLPKVLI